MIYNKVVLQNSGEKMVFSINGAGSTGYIHRGKKNPDP